jgi:hypothetical protein
VSFEHAVDTPLGWFGLPPDAPAAAALALAIAWGALVYSGKIWPRAANGVAIMRRTTAHIAFWPMVAAALSAAYVAYYLRGGPRVIDATSYLLAAKAIASGVFCFATGLPSAAIRGRFLIGADATECVGVLFPPGYPLALAGAVSAGFPMLLGPLIAAAQTSIVWLLGRRYLGQGGAGVAAALYVLSGCARYHTADTMSHGWAALLLSGACYAWGFRSAWGDRIGGVCWGWLVATRPVTGVVGLFALSLLHKKRVAGEPAQRGGLFRRGANAMLGAAPFLGLLLWYNHALTGDVLLTPQSLYYALADGEPGCFRYGFGPNVGCRHEHGDFMTEFMPHGYGLVEALGTTSRRLFQHLRDAGNSELGAIALVLAGASRRVRQQHAWLPFVVCAQVLAYLPFYYDGNYPAGGARMFADVLPLEHLLLAAWLAPLSLGAYAAPLSLLGFALHGAHDHLLLGSREGGRPLFEHAVVAQAGARRGLLFMPSDHGFNLAYQPSPLIDLQVVRRRGDGHDRVAWEQRGKPPSYVYDWRPEVMAEPRLAPYDVSLLDYRFEAENEWPVLGIEDAWAQPIAGAPCLSGALGLRLNVSGSAPYMVLELPVPQSGLWRVGVGSHGGAPANVDVDGTSLTLHAAAAKDACLVRWSAPRALAAGARRIGFRPAPSDTVTIDFIELRAVDH